MAKKKTAVKATTKPGKTTAGQEPATATTSGSSSAPLKVVDTSAKICKPFVLQVMVFAPQTGFKIEVNVERTCTPQADPIWKLVFDLYKQQAGGSGFDQLVHVSYTGATPVEQRGLATTFANGLNDRQSDVVVNRAGPAVLKLKDAGSADPADLEQTKADVKSAGKDIATFAL